MRHFYSFLLLAVLSCVAGTNAWAYDFVADGIYYNITSSENLTVEVTYGTSTQNSYSGDVVIPAAVEHDGKTYSVTRIGNSAFSYCTSLTSVAIPESVTEIGQSAFRESGLFSLEVPSSVTSIKDLSFDQVKNVVYDGSAQGSPWSALTHNGISDGDFIFADAEKTKLTVYIGSGGDVEIPSTVTSIGGYAFKNCTNVTSVTMSEGVTSFGWETFSGCTSLKSIKLPNSLKNLGAWTFRYCSSLTDIYIPEGITVISDCTFSGCSSLSKVTLPESVTSIGYLAFSSCYHLSSINIPKNVTSIGQQAFYVCQHIKSLELPEGVSYIGDQAFYGVKNVVYSGTATGSPWGAKFVNAETDEKGFAYSDEGKKEIVAYLGNDLDIVVPEGVTTIAEYAFEYDGLKSITIPESVTSINEDAFSNCDSLTTLDCNSDSIGQGFYWALNLKTVIFGNSVTNIDEYAFRNHYKLSSVTLSNSLISIGQSAFSECSGLTSLVVPETVTSIGYDAFYQVKNVVYSGNATGRNWGALAVNGIVEGGFVYTDVEKTTLAAYVGKGGDVVVPESVKSINQYAFKNCDALTSVTIGTNVSSLVTNAFDECYNMTDLFVPDENQFYASVDGLLYNKEKTEILLCPKGKAGEIIVPNTVTTIGSSSFDDCMKITSVFMPESVSKIESYAFNGCTGLKSVTFSEGLTEIGSCAFQSAWSLTSVVIPKTVMKIDYGAFRNTSSIKSLTICEGVKELGREAFESFAGESLVIPNSVTTLGNSAIKSCYSLKELTIGYRVKEITANNFSNGCSSLSSIYMTSLVPPVCGSNVLRNVNKSTCVLYVPEGSVDAYRAADFWKDFVNIEVNPNAVTPEYWLTYKIGNETIKTDTIAYGATVTPAEAPTREGYTFNGWISLPETMPAEDLTVTGTFTVNRYAVIYMVDGEEYRRDSVEYGATITLAENPTKESHDFSGWSGYPENLTMPAGDVIITGGFQFNGLAGVAAASIGDEYFDLTGKPLSQPQRGINLVRKADGTTRKIIVK